MTEVKLQGTMSENQIDTTITVTTNPNANQTGNGTSNSNSSSTDKTIKICSKKQLPPKVVPVRWVSKDSDDEFSY